MSSLRSLLAVWFPCAMLFASALSNFGHAQQSEAGADWPVAGAVKVERKPIYDEKADNEELIAAALRRAKLEHKHVLIEWGGNWCGWCFKLHDVFHQDELVRPIVFEEYELVLIDALPNIELLRSYAGKETSFGYPYLTVLDADGKVLTNQRTGALEVGDKHDPQAVATFLKEWQPEPLDAEDLLAAALRQAAKDDKRVLMHVGDPYCGWCKILTQFLSAHESNFARDFIDLKIDTKRMRLGKEVADRFHPATSSGVPWMVIVDGSGKVLSTSIGPRGNIGYPMNPVEIDHFLEMLVGTKQRMGDEDLRQIRADLDAYRMERERLQNARKE